MIFQNIDDSMSYKKEFIDAGAITFKSDWF